VLDISKTLPERCCSGFSPDLVCFRENDGETCRSLLPRLRPFWAVQNHDCAQLSWGAYKSDQRGLRGATDRFTFAVVLPTETTP
jgi:hypothetical protein